MEAITGKASKEKPENKCKTKISWAAKKQKEIELLRSAIIYGANDAGKTNLIKALITLRNLVLFSFRSPLSENGQSQNFLLDKSFQNKPSIFNITFIKDEIKYCYSISTDFRKIISEELISFQYGSPRTIISRNEDKIILKIEGKKEHIESSTKSGSLLLSTAIGVNTDNETLLKVYNFIIKDIQIDSGNVSFDFRTKSMILNENETQIIEIFKEAIGDGIIDVQLTKDETFNNQRIANFFIGKDGNLQIIDENQLPKEAQDENKRKRELDQYKVSLIRKNIQGEKVNFELNQYESKGTQKLFHYLGPIVDTLKKGRVFILDELDDAIHPKLMQFVINLFHSKKYNKKNAQLILTSHNAALIGKQLDIFRRDQIWFVDKSDNQNSLLYPLTDYYTRKDANFADYYLAGRYGAIRDLGEEISNG
jgi:AAA15 family ATPase/GTPase